MNDNDDKKSTNSGDEMPVTPSSSQPSLLPRRTKMNLVVTPSTTTTNNNSKMMNTGASTNEASGGPQFPRVSSDIETKNQQQNLASSSSSNPGGLPPRSPNTASNPNTPPPSSVNGTEGKKKTASFAFNKKRGLPRGATVITSTRGNISFFQNLEQQNNNQDETNESGGAIAVPNNSIAADQHQSFSSAAGVFGSNSKNNNEEHQYRVSTGGRKTYIQKVNSFTNNNSLIIGGAQNKPSAAANNNSNEMDASSSSPNDGDNNNNNEYRHQHHNVVIATDEIDPQNGEVLEITHSADEPIPNLSFFTIGEGYYLPRPETVVPCCSKYGNPNHHHHHHDHDDTKNNGDEHNNHDAEDEDDDNETTSSSSSDDGSEEEQEDGQPTDSFLEFEYNNIHSINQSSPDAHRTQHDQNTKKRNRRNTKTSSTGSGVAGGAGGGGGGGGDGNNNNNSIAVASDKSASSKPSTWDNVVEIFRGSKNVPRMFLYNLLDGACFGLWQASVIPAFMYIIGGDSNSFVGYNAAVQGSCQMFSALVAAYVGDKRIWPKRYLLRLASLVGCIAIAITVMAVNTRSPEYFWPSSALWGIYIGFANPSSESIFADSVPGGQRVAVYTYKWILQLLSYLFGYITTVIMFEKYGDKWALNEMTPVLYAGLFAHISSMISLWFLHDDFTLDVHKERNGTNTTNNNATSSGKNISSSKNPSQNGIKSGPTYNNTNIQSATSINSNKNKDLLHADTIHTNNLKSCSSCGKLKLMRGKITSFKVPQQQQSKTAEENGDDEKNQSGTTIKSNNSNNNNEKEEKQQQQQQQKVPSQQQQKKSYESCKCVITERDKDIIEELEDDAKREKTGDPLLVDICPALCCLCCGGGGNSCCCSGSSDQKEYKEHDETSALLGGNNGKKNNEESSVMPSPGVCAKMTLVPILIVTGDIFQAVGGGVTVRFFPLFFMNDLSVTPVELAVVSIILCVFAAVLSNILKRFSANFRRTSLIVIIRLLGSGLMFLLEFAEGAIGHKYPMLSYFVLRSALLNSMMGLSRSIIMDFCRKRHRTFFSAMESVSTLSFSGSAAIGGVIADKKGYRSTFGVTAGFYVASALMVLPAGWWVDKNLAADAKKKKEEAAAAAEKKKE